MLSNLPVMARFLPAVLGVVLAVWALWLRWSDARGGARTPLGRIAAQGRVWTHACFVGVHILAAVWVWRRPDLEPFGVSALILLATFNDLMIRRRIHQYEARQLAAEVTR